MSMVWGYDSIITIFLAIFGSIVVIVAQLKINASYSKYKGIFNNKKLSGQEVARMILDSNNLDNIHIVEVSGTLTDHYDPNRKVIRLSKDIFNGESIAALAVAAHEVGHAIQDKENYNFMRIRTMLVPIVNFISYSGYVVILISLIAGMTSYVIYGILLLIATILFQLATLPVEIDASKRAHNELLKLNIINSDEEEGVKNVLTSAAMTYLASLISSILNLLRLILIYRDRD